MTTTVRGKSRNMATQIIHPDSVSARNRSESESESRPDRTVIHLRMPYFLLLSLKRLGRSNRQGYFQRACLWDGTGNENNRWTATALEWS